MKRFLIAVRSSILMGVLFSVLFSISCSSPQNSQSQEPSKCFRDNQCKEDRICGQDGRCIEPTEPGDKPDTTDTSSPDDISENSSDSRDIPEPAKDSTTDSRTDTSETNETETDAPCKPHKDCDDDGINNCDEENYGTDKCNADSDGDGLDDNKEINEYQTNPLKADSDGDGVPDGKEIELSLDPTSEKSFDDGVSDGQRWRVDACSNVDPKKARYVSHPSGNWGYALPQGYKFNPISVSTYSDTGGVFTKINSNTENFGLIYSTKVGSQEVTELLHDRFEKLKEITSVDKKQEFAVRELQSKRATDRVLLKIKEPQPIEPYELRKNMFSKFSDTDTSNLNGFPNKVAPLSDTYQAALSVTILNKGSQDARAVTTIVVTADKNYQADNSTKYHFSDLTDGTAIGLSNSSLKAECIGTPKKPAPSVYLYWVLDQSGSMEEYYETLISTFDNVFQELKRMPLTVKHGVTSMFKQGRGMINEKWRVQLADFKGDVDWVENRCDNVGFGTGCGSEEYGLQNAENGIEHMKNSPSSGGQMTLEDGSQIVTVFMSDEEAQTVQNKGINSSEMAQFRTFFPAHTTALALVGNGNDCGTSAGDAYKDIAKKTGGASFGLCSGNYNPFYERLKKEIRQVRAVYKLPDNTVSGSIQVAVDEEVLSRSKDAGFDYLPNKNAILFYGDKIPEASNDPDMPDDFLVISYRVRKN